MIRLWYDQNGAAIGKPWKVQVADLEPFFAAEVRLRDAYTVFRKDEAPHGMMQSEAAWFVVDGTCRPIGEFLRAAGWDSARIDAYIGQSE